MEQHGLPDYLMIPGILIKDRNLQPLDGQVYGVIYWIAKQKLQRCIASNRYIASLLGVNPTSVANSIMRLTRGKYITSIMDDKHHRVELIPNLAFTPPNVFTENPTPSLINDTPPSSNDDTPFIKSLTPPSSNDEHNKSILIKEVNKTNTNVLEEKSSKLKDFGNSDINEVMNQFKLLFPNMTRIQQNRYACKRLLQKLPKDRVLKAIEFYYKMRDEEFAPVITNPLDLELKWDKLEAFARRTIKERSGQYDRKRGIDARGI